MDLLIGKPAGGRQSRGRGMLEDGVGDTPT
jgi:hypothetical protein